jgi:hypothetical protein
MTWCLVCCHPHAGAGRVRNAHGSSKRSAGQNLKGEASHVLGGAPYLQLMALQRYASCRRESKKLSPAVLTFHGSTLAAARQDIPTRWHTYPASCPDPSDPSQVTRGKHMCSCAWREGRQPAGFWFRSVTSPSSLSAVKWEATHQSENHPVNLQRD